MSLFIIGLLKSVGGFIADHRKPVFIALALAVLSGWSYQEGAASVQAKWDRENDGRAVKVAQIEQKQAEATVQVVTKYVDRVKVVREKGDTIIKEVPIYVQADVNTLLSGGFRLLFDAAVIGKIPDPARIADAPAVAVADVADTTARNLEACRLNAAQLEALQEWVRAQQEASK